jgi:hypothetical protein
MKRQFYCLGKIPFFSPREGGQPGLSWVADQHLEGAFSHRISESVVRLHDVIQLEMVGDKLLRQDLSGPNRL